MKQVLTGPIRRALRYVGYDLVSLKSPAALPGTADVVDPATEATVAAVGPFTMTSRERLVALIEAVRYLVRYRVPGDVVECGVWRGGSMMAVARTLVELGDTGRTLFLFDTFEGMPPPTDRDRDCNDYAAAKQLRSTPKDTGVWCYAGLDDVRANIATTGYPADRIHFVQGKVEDTIPDARVGGLALLRLDTDWYESTKHELEHLYPKLAAGGILIIDDYGHWAGARQATDEYLAARPDHPLLLNRIDYTGRLAVKPPAASR